MYVCVWVWEGERETCTSACMSESGHCSRKSDTDSGHPENISATVVWQAATERQLRSLLVCVLKHSNVTGQRLVCVVNPAPTFHFSPRLHVVSALVPARDPHRQRPVTCPECYAAASHSRGWKCWFQNRLCYITRLLSVRKGWRAEPRWAD